VSLHVRILSALYIILGIVGLFSAFFWSVAMGALAAAVGASNEEGAGVGAAILGFTGVALTIFFVAISIPSILCGWGLLKYRRWARILAIVLAAISLVKFFPLGTIFGAYALWVLFKADTEALFTR
jgi:hypothetical protein